MASSYSGNPASSSKDAVRFYVRDTRDGAFILSDEEIAFALGAQSEPMRCAAALCRQIALDLGNEDDSKGATEWKSNEKYQHYMDMAERLEAQADANVVPMMFGGLTLSQKAALSQDADRVQPFFTRELQKNNEAE